MSAQYIGSTPGEYQEGINLHYKSFCFQ
uniref:Uncharacterized protein n=1 Tax=Rhizophora mucronata TaxID=61149 RepID=A0A2P2PJF5_RHIMU